jgi:hypothetical protein
VLSEPGRHHSPAGPKQRGNRNGCVPTCQRPADRNLRPAPRCGRLGPHRPADREGPAAEMPRRGLFFRKGRGAHHLRRFDPAGGRDPAENPEHLCPRIPAGRDLRRAPPAVFSVVFGRRFFGQGFHGHRPAAGRLGGRVPLQPRFRSDVRLRGQSRLGPEPVVPGLPRGKAGLCRPGHRDGPRTRSFHGHPPPHPAPADRIQERQRCAGARLDDVQR